MEDETGFIGESWQWRWIGQTGVTVQNRYFDGYLHRFLEFWNTEAETLDSARIPHL
jgi:hypothetical protein